MVPSLPFQPVCDPDCPGLCSRCGARLMDDPDHSHEESDPRWSALQSLTLTDQNDGTATPADPDRTQEETN